MDACTPPEPNRAAENGPHRDRSSDEALFDGGQGRLV